MADQNFAPNQGFRFSLPGFPVCVCAWYTVPELGYCCGFFVGRAGSVGFDLAKLLVGPIMLNGGQQAGETLAQVPALLNAAIDEFLADPKSLPAVPGNAVADPNTMNLALAQYYALDANNHMIQVPFPALPQFENISN